MTITIKSTARIVMVKSPRGLGDGMECRVWEGETERGIKVQCLIPRIAACAGADLAEFEADLREESAPSADIQMFPLRLVL